MSASLIDPRSESPALRRVSLLLERLRQDGLADADMLALQTGLDTLRRAAAAGRTVQRIAIQRLSSVASAHAVPPVRRASMAEILRASVFVEMDELLRRLSTA